MTQYSNGTEFLSESALRKRIGGCFCGSDDPRYAEAGFYPVKYAALSDFQTHDRTAAYIVNGFVIVPATDLQKEEINLLDLKEEINQLRKNKEFSFLPIQLREQTYYFSTSQTSQFNLEVTKKKKDGKTRHWIMTDAYIIQDVTDDEIDEIYEQVSDFKDSLFLKQANLFLEIEDIYENGTVDDLRNFMQAAKEAFE